MLSPSGRATLSEGNGSTTLVLPTARAAERNAMLPQTFRQCHEPALERAEMASLGFADGQSFTEQ